MNPRILGLSLAVVLVFAIGAGSGLAAPSSAYVTTDTECDEPIDLEVNALQDGEYVFMWLNLHDFYLYELSWTLYDKGAPLASGVFDWVGCTSGDGKYTLAQLDGGFNNYLVAGSGDLNDLGSYTIKVWITATEKKFSADSFRVVST